MNTPALDLSTLLFFFYLIAFLIGARQLAGQWRSAEEDGPAADGSTGQRTGTYDTLHDEQ